jgi:hypothetical protein
VRRLFNNIASELLKVEEYIGKDIQEIYNTFKVFHRETIHYSTTTKAREAFTKLLLDESELTEPEVQTYLYHLQQEINQFREKRNQYLQQEERRKQSKLEHSSVQQTTTTEEQVELLNLFGQNNPETFEQLIQQTPIKKYFSQTVKSPSKPEIQASSSNIKRKQKITPVIQR